MRTTILRGLAAASLLVSTAACSLATRHAGAPLDSRAPTVVSFRNDSWDLTDVYALRQGGIPIRLGSVAAGRTERLVVPRDLVFGGPSVQIIARPLARNRVIGSGPVSLSPGEHLQMSLISTGNMISVLPGAD